MATASRDAAFSALKEMFPGVADRLIKIALFHSVNDVSDAAEFLLSEGLAPADESPSDPPAPLQDPSPSESPPDPKEPELSQPLALPLPEPSDAVKEDPTSELQEGVLSLGNKVQVREVPPESELPTLADVPKTKVPPIESSLPHEEVRDEFAAAGVPGEAGSSLGSVVPVTDTLEKNGAGTGNVDEAQDAEFSPRGDDTSPALVKADAHLLSPHQGEAPSPTEGGPSLDWVVTTPADASPVISNAIEDGHVVVNADGGVVEEDGPLSASVMSLSVLGSEMESPFDKDSFDSALNGASELKGSLVMGIKEVEELRVKVLHMEVRANQASKMLQAERDKAAEETRRNAFMLQKAKDNLNDLSSVLASERGILHFEARQLRSQLEEQGKQKLKLQAKLQVLKEGLLKRLAELEKRIKVVEDDMVALQEARVKRNAELDAEMAAIAEQEKALEREKQACDDLKSFLDDRKGAVDNIASGIAQCADDIQQLCLSIESNTFGSEGSSLASSTASLAAGAAAAALLSSASVRAQKEPSLSMREALPGFLSSPEGSVSSTSSPSLSASVEALGTSPRQAALHMLSLMSGEGEMEQGGDSGVVGASPAGLNPLDACSEAPVVRVSEDGALMGDGEDPRVVVEAVPGADKEDGWEDVKYPEAEAA